MGWCVLVVCLLWSLVEVHSQQTFPYVSFMGQTLDNNSYVNLSLVGDYDDSVQCHSDLSMCCSSVRGSHRGDWYFPNGTRLPFSGSGDIFEARINQRVDIRHWKSSNLTPIGIYRCDIPTTAVHDYINTSVRDTVYVGLYTSGGGSYVVMVPV